MRFALSNEHGAKAPLGSLRFEGALLCKALGFLITIAHTLEVAVGGRAHTPYLRSNDH